MFFSNETSEKIHNSIIQVKISVKNVIFSNEMEKKPKYYTYFSIEFGKIHLENIMENFQSDSRDSTNIRTCKDHHLNFEIESKCFSY